MKMSLNNMTQLTKSQMKMSLNDMTQFTKSQMKISLNDKIANEDVIE